MERREERSAEPRRAPEVRPLPIALDRGFYVAVSDRDLIGKVQDLLRQQGYLGYMDTSGRLNYLVDGRRNLYRASHTIARLGPQLLAEGAGAGGRAQPGALALRRLSKRILERHGFSMQHKGSLILQDMLLLAYENEGRLFPLSKFLYPAAAKKYAIKTQQVDRLIRYATQASQLRMGNSALLKHLSDELFQAAAEQAEEGRKKDSDV